MCADFIGKNKEKSIRKNVWGQKIEMTSGVYKRTKRTNKFRRSVEELREFTKENDIKLFELLKYMRRRNYKKIEKETMPKCQK